MYKERCSDVVGKEPDCVLTLIEPSTCTLKSIDNVNSLHEYAMIWRKKARWPDRATRRKKAETQALLAMFETLKGSINAMCCRLRPIQRFQLDRIYQYHQIYRINQVESAELSTIPEILCVKEQHWQLHVHKSIQKVQKRKFATIFMIWIILFKLWLG